MVKLLGNRKSKRQKLTLKYNVQKRIREHRRRCRKEAKKLGVKKRVKKDPGIPNTWPFKAQMLQDLERKKDQRDEELAKRRAEAKQKVKRDQKRVEIERRKVQQERETDRRQKRAAEADKFQHDALRRVLIRADVILEVLDARDPLGCRCAAIEAWAQEKGKRLIFVLTKADLVAPAVAVQWLQALGRVGPAVVVQVETGREGVRELLQLLGHTSTPTGAAAAESAPSTAPPAGPAPAAAVGIVGYPNTGKRVLCKAIRREAQGRAQWLLESVGRLRPAAGPLDAKASLHLTLRAALPHTTAGSAGVAPLDVVKHFFERATQQALMRRFRLPAFEGAEGFLRAFAKDRDIKTNKGKEAKPEFIARRFVADLSSPPGCICTPPEALDGTAVAWPAHGEARQALEAMMQAQAVALRDRAAGPAAGALMISSGGPGPAVDLSSILSSIKEGDAEMDAAEEDDDDEDGAEDGEEEDEEELEGEESEEDGEEDMDDEE